MARPNRTEEKRRELIPVIARTFAESGYRRTTTAELASRSGVQENILYRLWPDKKAMFIAAIEHVYDLSVRNWGRLLTEVDGGRSAALRLLEYEAEHLGEFGHARIVFAGLSETDDEDIRRALADMYQRYQRFLESQIRAHRSPGERRRHAEPSLAAWAVIGLGTAALVTRELGLLDDRKRAGLVREVGKLLLEGSIPVR
jgi:AcrR family transcriptional regulator